MLRKEKKITIFFTTHNLFFVENWAEKMLVLDEGKIIFEGAPHEGLNDSNVNKLLGSYNDVLSLIKKR